MREWLVAAVMISVDPHKASHTAVAIGAAEELLGQLRVRASAGLADRLVAWAAEWPERTWAVAGARGLGSLLAQQLVAAGERVLDVQSEPAARVRLLAAGDTNKSDPDDARSVAVAALRSATRREVQPDDHPAVLKVWSKRHRDLGRAGPRSPAICTLRFATWCQAASPRTSPPLTPPGSWHRSRRPAELRRPVASSPPSSWTTCAASMPRCATPGNG